MAVEEVSAHLLQLHAVEALPDHQIVELHVK
jgi:hypothetical protein